MSLKELERDLASSKNDFERKLQEKGCASPLRFHTTLTLIIPSASFYQWVSEPLGRLLLSQTSVLAHFKAMENSMEAIKAVQNKHTEFFTQAFAGVDDLSRSVTNLVDHVHDADFMADSLRGIQATIDTLRGDLKCLKGPRHTPDRRTRTLEDELLLVPDRLVSPSGPAGVHGDDGKVGYWVSVS